MHNGRGENRERRDGEKIHPAIHGVTDGHAVVATWH